MIKNTNVGAGLSELKSRKLCPGLNLRSTWRTPRRSHLRGSISRWMFDEDCGDLAHHTRRGKMGMRQEIRKKRRQSGVA